MTSEPNSFTEIGHFFQKPLTWIFSFGAVTIYFDEKQPKHWGLGFSISETYRSHHVVQRTVINSPSAECTHIRQFYVIEMRPPRATVVWSALKLRVKAVSGSTVSQETGYSDWNWQIGHDRFLPHHFKFSIHNHPTTRHDITRAVRKVKLGNDQ
jgi:hypothetical protein